MKYLKYIIMSAALACGITLAGCVSEYQKTIGERTTTTNYDLQSGKISNVVVLEKDVVDNKKVSNSAAIAEAIRDGGDGKAIDRSFNFSKFGLGYEGIGLDWTSIAVASTGAPSTPEKSKEIFEGMADVKAAGKTTLQTAKVGVNTNVAKTSETKEETVTSTSTTQEAK